MKNDMPENNIDMSDKWNELLLQYGDERAFFAAWFLDLVPEEDKRWFLESAEELGYGTYAQDLQNPSLANEYQDLLEVAQCLVIGQRVVETITSQIVIGAKVDGIQPFQAQLLDSLREMDVVLPSAHHDELLEMLTNYLTGDEAIQRFRELDNRFNAFSALRSPVVKFVLSGYSALWQPKQHSLSYRTFVGNRLLKLVWEHSHEGIPESQRWCQNFLAVQQRWLQLDLNKLVEPLKSTDIDHSIVAAYIRTDSTSERAQAITDLAPERVDELANRKDWDRLGKLFRKYPILTEVVRSQGGSFVDTELLINQVVDTLKANPNMTISIREVIWNVVRSHIELQSNVQIGSLQKAEWERIVRRAVVRSEIERLKQKSENPDWITKTLDRVLEVGPSSVDELQEMVFPEELTKNSAFKDFRRFLSVNVGQTLRAAESESAFQYLLTA